MFVGLGRCEVSSLLMCWQQLEVTIVHRLSMMPLNIKQACH